jgi:hypothetical protein
VWSRAGAPAISAGMTQYQDDQVPTDAPEADIEAASKRIPTPVSESFSSPGA